jgi:RND family efflux transporter MFP subunit
VKRGRHRLEFSRSLTLFIAAIAGLISCGNHRQPLKTQIAVTVLTVRGAPASNSGIYTASFEPYRLTRVSFQAAGYVNFIKQVSGADGRQRDIQGGDAVKAHELLAAIRSDTYEAQVRQAASALAGAQAVYAKTKSDFARDSQLFRLHVIAPETYDLGLQQYQSAESQIGQAKAALQQARITLGYCQLNSPMDGVILERGIEIGSLAEPGIVAFQVADIAEMKAVFGTSDIEVGHLKLGQRQIVTAEAIDPVPLAGTITRIAPNADPTTRNYAVEVTIPNPDHRIRVGMIAFVKLAGAAPGATAITLPLNAIVRPPDSQKDFAVYVIDNQSGQTLARLHRVELGNIAGNEIAVTSGVQIGDQVIVRGATMVADGAEVRIIP